MKRFIAKNKKSENKRNLVLLGIAVLSAFSLSACASIHANNIDNIDLSGIKTVRIDDIVTKEISEITAPPPQSSSDFINTVASDIPAAKNTEIATNYFEKNVTAEVTEITEEPQLNPVFTSDPDTYYDEDQFLTGRFTKEQIDYLHNCVFFGDSITLSLKNYGLVSADRVLSAPGLGSGSIDDYTFNVNGQELDAVSALKAQKVSQIYLLIGLNDVNLISPEEYKENYLNFLKEAQQACPNADIHIFSVTPVTEASNFCYNSKLDKLNLMLKEIAEESGGKYAFVDIASVLKDENGCLKAEYAYNDGIHLKLAPYYEILKVVCSQSE